MALTFETALAKITKHKKVKTLWENWYPRLLNHSKGNPLNVGMLPLFLCDEMVDIKKHLGESQFYGLLKEMAAFAASEDAQTLVITPNPKGEGQDWWTPSSPLRKAIIKRDSGAVNILLNHTPLEGVNQKIPAFELKAQGMHIHYMLTFALNASIRKEVLYRLLSMTTCEAALEEALRQTTFGEDDFFDGMRGYGRKVITGEIHDRIQTQLDLVKSKPDAAREQALRAQQNSSLASIVSMFSNAFSGMFGSSKTVKVGGPR